jgi:DNA primase
MSSVIDVYTLASLDTVLHRASRGRYQGPCPKCGGTDRFYVTLIHRSGDQRWGCNNCNPGYHDAIDYLRYFKDMSFPEAKAYVAGNQDAISHAKARVDRAIQDVATIGKSPGQDWQDRTHTSILSAAAALYSEQGQTALQYLHGRGLTDETIKKAKLGYAIRFHPKLQRDVACIVFPWYENGLLWRVQFRTIEAVKQDERYFLLGGSSNSSLYLADSLNLQRSLTVLVEGEIDALTLAQECSDICNVVATGSTTGSRTIKSVLRLAHCGVVLVSFDNEEKGNANAQYWLARLDNAIRYRPLIHDVNAMHTAGLSVRSWIVAAAPDVPSETDQEDKPIDILPAGRNNNNVVQVADTIAPPDQTVTIDQDVTSVDVDQMADELQDDEEDITRCSFCSKEVAHFSETGIALCSQHKKETDAAIALLKSIWSGPDDKIELIPGKPPVRIGASTEPIAAAPILPSELLTLATCAHYEIKLIRDKNNSFLAKPDGLCKNKRVMPGLFCEQHKHHTLILEMGAKVGYPALQLNQYVSIEVGYSAWLEHARRRTTEQLIGIVPKKGREKLSPEINGDLQVIKLAIDRILQPK